MSVHPIPSPTNDPADSMRWDRVEQIRRLCRVYGREPTHVIDDGTTLSLVFEPDLTPAQETMLRRLIRISGMLRITPAEWANIEDDLTTGIAFVQNAVPTNAQSVAAVKSLWRVLGALLRD
jgi:hypothetical protein